MMKRLFITALIMVITVLPVSAKSAVKAQARMTTDYSIGDNAPIEIKFMPGRKVNFGRGVNVQSKSVITAEVYQAQKERRWHKSGFVICKLLSYTEPDSEKEIDISNRDIYMLARKYERVNAKDAAILSTEITTTSVASIFLPGVDIAYFFTKGAIQREKHPNWFKAGVSNAYDNSICWFWLKGKPIDVQSGDEIQLVSIKKTKARKIKAKADKKSIKIAQKKEKKAAKQELKSAQKCAKSAISQ